MNHRDLVAPAAPAAPGQAQQRILVVDDEPRIRAGLCRLLAQPGRELVEAGTGAGAIDLLQRLTLDLVLLDIGLPDISGLDVMRWIAQYRPDTSVIIVSSDGHFETAIRALRSGAVEFVRKPDDLDLLPDRVDNALLRSRLKREHLLMTTRLVQSERLHRFLIENSPDIVYTLDTGGNFVFVNPRVESLLAYGRDELLGRHCSAIVHEDDRELARHVLAERRCDSRASTNVEVRLLCKRDPHATRARKHIVATLSAIGLYEDRPAAEQAPGRRFVGSYGVARDITERKRAEEIISFQALHDHLTQLPNRRLFKDHLELALVQAARRGGMVGVMFVDLDRFKLVNDTHGHLEGDELLKNFAQRLRGCVRAGDTVGRQGGDEFTVLLPDLAHADDALVVAHKLFAALEQPFALGGQDFRATASVGIAVYPRDGSQADLLLKNADIAMYKVKSSGKNGCQLFSADMHDGYRERLALENDLRQAIVQGDFTLHYQPRVDLRRDRVVGVEALIRWQHAQRGLLSPGDFIDLAEEAGLIFGISDWVIEEACRQLAQWHREGHAGMRMSINLSPLEFNRADLVERVVSRVARHGLPRDALEIEITENVLLQDVPGVIATLHQLRDQGVQVAIDDFGTRYSSLNYLRRFPLNSIKIDQSFVRDIVEGDAVSPIIHAVVGIARGFKLHLVAEGVETELQRQVLSDLGCDEMQGYLFASPAPAQAIAPLFGRPLRAAPARPGSAGH